MPYNKINNLLGWLCFIIAATTYTLTLEPSVSFWDCGEFISCAYRLQVSHQPGYPLFAMIGKVFSLLSFGDRTKVAYFTNWCSALASAATVMFLFWTITALAKKMVSKSHGGVVTRSGLLLIMAAGLTGAMAFAFSDTFWFSAVETIVFALSALCIALVFWAITKWDSRADEPRADRWLVFIAYVMGLSIGIHLLNLLTIPALTLVYYFRKSSIINVKKTFITLLLGVALLAFVQWGIIQYTVKFAGWFDLYFVNTLGLGFGTGAILFFVILISSIVWGVFYSIRKGKYYLHLALMCLSFLYLGYSCFVYVPIRATANPTLNNSHPDNAFTLASYLNRDQYPVSPVLYGPYFDAQPVEQEQGAPRYRKGDDKYELTGYKQSLIYDHNTLLPRIFSNGGQNPRFYREWMQMAPGHVPTFADNVGFMFSWQIYQMYVRYFLWNFVGRYNDVDGQNSTAQPDGNWTTGIFDGAKPLPPSVTQSPAYAPLYGLPLVIGLIGMLYHYKQRKRDAVVITVLWFFLGLAIVLYINQPGIQPRERDYSYVGSFYAYAIWIGLGVLGIAQLLMRVLNARRASWLAAAICLVCAPLLMAAKEWPGHNRSQKMVAHDMAYNYMVSCPPNAILFTYADNDTYPLWYLQEVENVRPDIRLINLSLFGSDWLIRQMQYPVNKSAPLPVTMPFSKYKSGTRDVIYFHDEHIDDYVNLKDVFDFITSDNPDTMIQYQSGRKANYLPLKKFKLEVNPTDVKINNVLSAAQQVNLTDTLRWKFNSDAIVKNDLAMLDIILHNRWRRPICITATAGLSNMQGLDDYMYHEGFIYRLLPLKPDTSNTGDRVNTSVMYNKVMNDFKFGNFKHASYLDQQSVNLFYPVLTGTFLTLARQLAAEGQKEKALKVLRKYDEVMPNLNPYIQVAARKANMAEIAYHMGDAELGNKLAAYVYNYVAEEAEYNYKAYKDELRNADLVTVKWGIDYLDTLAGTAREAGQINTAQTIEAIVLKNRGRFGRYLQFEIK